MSTIRTYFPDSEPTSLNLFFLLNAACLALSGAATQTNFIAFGLTRPGLETTIYRIRREHANHFTTDAVQIK